MVRFMHDDPLDPGPSMPQLTFAGAEPTGTERAEIYAAACRNTATTPALPGT